MRIVPFVISTVITAGLVVTLNKKWGPLPPLGKFLSPQQGFWQNAEATDHNFSADLKISGLKGRVEVYFDDRLVPHIFADNDEDLYFAQGYIHAKFRLWQMEFQTFAASGRISEHLGNDPRFINYDRETRRLGMVYAAENALKVIEADPSTKSGCDAYTAGVNAYIQSLTYATMPLEYKLLDYKPENWSNLKIALFLKQMSRTLAGFENDLAYTNMKSAFSFKDFMVLDKQVPDSLEPIVPKGTKFDSPGIVPIQPASADSLYFSKKESINIAETGKPDPNNGSNNWAVSGKKTQSGAPILCNDPHLELTFPSIWYEMQLNSPTVNVYGATFPGSPNVIIGYNDSIAFGFTNAQRDVKDYYEIKFKDDSKQEYWYNGKWERTNIRVEQIKVRGAKTVLDTVAYTVFGPVMYDKSFSTDLSKGKALAVRWVAHDPSNEGLMWFYLDRAKNYDDYYKAIQVFQCPGQNMLFASKSGEIAIWQQAKFPARWYGQGLFVMPGEDSSYQWQGYIPQKENPHVINPERGFIVSANQRPVDSTYPYFIPGNYITMRGLTITRRLEGMEHITPEDMMKLQYDYYNTFAEEARPLLMKYIRENDLNADGKKYLDMVKNWDLQAGPYSTGQTVFTTWWDSLMVVVFQDELDQVHPEGVMPESQTLLEALLKDSTFKYIDNINTPQKETLFDDVTAAFQKSVPILQQEEKDDKLQWTKHQDPTIYHILKSITAFAKEGIPVGGDGDIINATTHSHGPSWRMIVQLSSKTEAFGVFPGGESGNPGSKFYDNFVDKWAKGEYYTLWMMQRSEAKDKRVRWVITMHDE
ncbi:MAG: penicillin acylase family protein [Bacteroidetes bacterium]|nr:penicillin acylase family protein [Bacteroidota bacterium]MBS1932226.1 penicillin acylase family protein [Bacteroidota bacterium]